MFSSNGLQKYKSYIIIWEKYSRFKENIFIGANIGTTMLNKKLKLYLFNYLYFIIYKIYLYILIGPKNVVGTPWITGLPYAFYIICVLCV
jgi:hypothetical protein